MTQPLLVDHLGRPIDTSALRQVVSQPSVTGVRSIAGGHPASGLTPERLSSLLIGAEQGDATRYYELAEQMEEKDLHYLGVLQQRKRAVAQLEITVEAAGTDADSIADADLVREWIARESIEDELFDMLDAVGKGTSLMEIEWDLSDRLWWPERLLYVDPRWTEFDRIDGRTLLLKGDDGLPQPLAPFKFIQSRIQAKSGLPVRGGLARPVAWAWMFKNYTVKDWVAFAEIYGLPFRVGKYGPEASADEKKKLLQAVAEFGHDAAAIIPKSMDIEFIDGGASNGDGALFLTKADWWDRQVSKAVLGQTMTTDAGAAGLGSNQAEVQDGVRADIEKADAKALAAALNRDLVQPLVALNRGQRARRKYPRLVIGRAEAWDPATKMPQVERFVNMGGRVGEADIRDRLGLPEPGPDEQILKPAQTAEPAAPGSAPRTPPAAPSAPLVPELASQRFLGLLRGINGAISVAAQTPAAQSDAIERFIGANLGDWEQVVEPMLAPIEALIAECSSLDELRGRLTERADELGTEQLVDVLAPALFAARLAGAAGLTVADAAA